MPDMSLEQKSKRLEIKAKGISSNAKIDFLYNLFEAFKNGYAPAPRETAWRRDMPTFRNGMFSCALYPKDYEVPSPASAKSLDAANELSSIGQEIQPEDYDTEGHVFREDKPDQMTAEEAGEFIAALNEGGDGEISPEDFMSDSIEEAVEELGVMMDEKDILSEINSLSKKQDLLKKAEELNIEVPEEKKQPKAIKQHLINKLKEK